MVWLYIARLSQWAGGGYFTRSNDFYLPSLRLKKGEKATAGEPVRQPYARADFILQSGSTLQMKGRWQSNINVWFSFMYYHKWNCYFQNRIIMFSLQDPTLIYICKRFIYVQDRSAYSAAGKYVDRSWEYINRSQIHECRNWDWGRAIPRKGIHNGYFLCSVWTRILCPGPVDTLGRSSLVQGLIKAIWPAWETRSTELLPSISFSVSYDLHRCNIYWMNCNENPTYVFPFWE